jgi:hypothetical protein
MQVNVDNQRPIFCSHELFFRQIFFAPFLNDFGVIEPHELYPFFALWDVERPAKDFGYLASYAGMCRSLPLTLLDPMFK